MAKKAWIEREKKKRQTIKKYAALRAELKAKGDYAGLAGLPRNASPSRATNRCSMISASIVRSTWVCITQYSVT